MDILLIGAPGAGKGTQAEKLSQLLALRHVASGDLFRKAFEEQTELGLKAQTYVDLGELVPDEITIPMVMRHMEEPESMQGVLLDGYPRTLAQAQELDAELQRVKRQIDLAIYLKVSRDQVLLQRLAGRVFCQANQHVKAAQAERGGWRPEYRSGPDGALERNKRLHGKRNEGVKGLTRRELPPISFPSLFYANMKEKCE